MYRVLHGPRLVPGRGSAALFRGVSAVPLSSHPSPLLRTANTAPRGRSFGVSYRDSMRSREFANRLDTFLNLLCDSAQFGVSEGRERTYRKLRTYLRGAYAEVGNVFASYLRDDHSMRSGTAALRPRRLRDTIQILLAPTSLSRALRSDDGSLVFKIYQVRMALEGWQESLRT